MSDEEKEALEILKAVGIKCKGICIDDVIINLIEKQQKEIEELKKYKEGYKLLSYSLDNYTSKDKIKAKIEELEKLDFGTDLVSQFTANLTTITILQSLLEKE